MRKLGFRIWDTFARRMLYHTGLCMKDNVICSMKYGVEGSDDLNEFVIMQFTGLHDINGQYIFEGDIYVCMSQWKSYINNEHGQNKMYLCVVKWNEKNAGFNLGAKSGYRVVGNIYENPEIELFDE